MIKKLALKQNVWEKIICITVTSFPPNNKSAADALVRSGTFKKLSWQKIGVLELLVKTRKWLDVALKLFSPQLLVWFSYFKTPTH